MKEAEISREIVDFLKMLGFAVYSTEQGYRKERGGTRQTPGIPDLIVIGHDQFTFVEVKTPKGKLNIAQQGFRDVALENEVGWKMWRDVREAWDWCAELGLIVEAT